MQLSPTLSTLAVTVLLAVSLGNARPMTVPEPALAVRQGEF